MDGNIVLQEIYDITVTRKSLLKCVLAKCRQRLFSLYYLGRKDRLILHTWPNFVTMSNSLQIKLRVIMCLHFLTQYEIRVQRILFVPQMKDARLMCILGAQLCGVLLKHKFDMQILKIWSKVTRHTMLDRVRTKS